MKNTILLVVCVSVLASGCSKKLANQTSLPTAPAPSSGQQFAFVSFPNGAAPDGALKYASSNSLKIVTFQHTIDIAGDKATAFLPAYPYESASMLRDRWQRAYATFIQSAATTIQQNAPLANSPSFAASTQTLSRAFSTTSATLPPLNGKFDAMIVVGPDDKVKALKSSSSVQVELISSESAQHLARPSSAEGAMSECYVPAAGRTITQPSPYYSGQREMYNYFGWNSICFINNATFELDVSLSPSSGTYLDSGTDWTTACVGAYGAYYCFSVGIPHYEYAVTNQPSAFLTLRTSSDLGTLYALGCAVATQLQAGKTYYTYWRTRNGNAGSDNASVGAEVGHNVCGTTAWSPCCGWGSQHTLIVKSYGVAVPGTRNW